MKGRKGITLALICTMLSIAGCQSNINEVNGVTEQARTETAVSEEKNGSIINVGV